MRASSIELGGRGSPDSLRRKTHDHGGADPDLAVQLELRESPVSDEQGLRLGRVVSVSGSQVVILLENHDNGWAAE